mmetsp:Transcript_17108/g.44557  ORF Transcript_17108/g.44557 Transcript_17108/m.44557 type:complete len:125 (-) Transcript_17108:1316-1690(-)
MPGPGANPGAAVSGTLHIRVRGFLGLTSKWVAVECTLRGTALTVAESDANGKKNRSKTCEVSGSGLTAVSDPSGFVLTPANGPTLKFRCKDDEDQATWMEALLEAKLSKPSGRQLGGQQACAVQ